MNSSKPLKCKRFNRVFSIVSALLLYCSSAYAQCTIQAGDYVCVDDLISFTATSSIGVTSATWKFGDGNSSNTTAPNHRYAAAGNFTVTVTILQNNGSTCVATKKIEVYNPPEVSLQMHSSSVYCLSQNKVCIIDNSTSGNTTTTSTKRVILWGDGGKTDSNNPKKGDKICYTYQQSGKFEINVEITNDKGCETIGKINTEVLHDFPGIFNTGRDEKSCISQTNWFQLDTTWVKFKDDITLAVIDYADGEKDTITDFTDTTFYHDFKSSGNYAVFLILTFKNGCQTRFKRDVGVSLDKVTINHSKSDSVACFPHYFEFSHPNISGAGFSWTAIDTAGNIVQNFGGQRVAYFNPKIPGKYYVNISIKKGDCISSKLDSIEVVGVLARPKLLNASQCDPNDTVYFCNGSITHRTNDLSYLWKFQDFNAEPCTTDTKNGVNTDKNCNFSLDENAKHLYDSNICSEIWLTVIDNTNGCRDSAKEYVIIKKPKADDFASDPGVRCVSSSVRFNVEDCYDNVQINYDSACGKDGFVDFRSPKVYKKTCDTSAWVTWGIVAITGDEKVYNSCDTSDYDIRPDRVCSDTFWFHRDFRLNPSPRPQAKLNFNGCLPATLVGSFYTKKQDKVSEIYYDWGDGNFDTVLQHVDSVIVPDFTHQYTTSGDYGGEITMVTDSGCSLSVFFDRKIGFYNDFSFLKPVCPGSIVQFIDTIIYWNDTNQYWHWEMPDNLDRPEEVYWDFDDGNGFGKHEYLPKHVFSTPGTYKVRMAPKDGTGCSDTATHIVVVENIRAGVADFTKKLICDDILQVFDSSSVADTLFDKITSYYWDFGDGKAPSYLKDPFHYYSSYGAFTITHVIQNKVGCSDTARVTINIDGPIPHFDILSDTVSCVPHTVEFKNNSSRATDYIWYFGDTSSNANSLSTKSDSNVSFTYTKPGIYYIFLYAGDSVVNPDNGNNVYYCNSTFPDTNALKYEVRRVVILPIPPVDFTVEGDLCKNTEVVLIDNSDSIYNTFKWYHNRDSVIATQPFATLYLNDTGNLEITYRPTYIPQGPYQRRCFDSITKTFNVFENTAQFTLTQDSICPIFKFTAEADIGDKLFWDFGHPNSGHLNTSFERFVEHNFAPDIGTFDVCLVSESIEGCFDTLCQEIESTHRFAMMIPNIITPNGDGLNDNLEIEMEGEDLYELTIYNRWGEFVYKIKLDPEPGSTLNWDGTVQSTGKTCPAGTYFYILKFREACIDDAKMEKYSGTVTLIYD
ncbi:MAG: gliding motility-associated-like protein [Bacteroidia bacterium]